MQLQQLQNKLDLLSLKAPRALDDKYQAYPMGERFKAYEKDRKSFDYDIECIRLLIHEVITETKIKHARAILT